MADTSSTGVHMLLYITSRSATNLLDETYGPENYNIEYVDVSGQIYCKLSIWDEEHKRYVVRMDTGEEAKISADKSLASDALKRTIVRLGVTELYSGPAIYIPNDGYGNRGYKVSEIEYDSNRNITHIVIVNRFGKEVYRWDEGSKPQTIPTAAPTAPTQDNAAVLKSFCSSMKTQPGVDITDLTGWFKFWNTKIENGEFTGTFNAIKMWESHLKKRNRA